MSLLAEGYEVVENTDEATKAAYPWAVKEKAEEEAIVLVDGEEYPYRAEGAQCKSVKYIRTFKDSQAGKYQPWIVPFEYTITDDDKENFTFYKMEMVAHSATAGEVADNSKIYVFIQKMNAGDKLKANKPYLVVPNSAMVNHEFIVEKEEKFNLSSEPTGLVLHMETSENYYNFFCNYQKTLQATQSHEMMYMSGGNICWNASADAKLGSYRWYVKVDSKGDDYTNDEFIFVEEDESNHISTTQFGADDNVEGIYTVGGVKVDEPVRGVNIIRYRDGQIKKVYIK